MDKCGYLLSLALMLDIKMLGGESAFPPGFCQIYSYNIHERGTRGQERHFFVCCNNADSKSCRGATYQKPSRPESFCSGQVIQQEGSHWTQMESDIFPEDGRFFCGGCCGQQTAKEICNRKMLSSWDGCTNWVQCFFRQCRNIIQNRISLKCSIPPAPHPEHYKQNVGIPPSNLTQDANIVNKQNDTSCLKEKCEEMGTSMKCQDVCCQKYCCLQDGSRRNLPKSPTFQLSEFQIIGIILGVAVFLVAMFIIGCLVTKQCGPTCDSIKVPTTDTHVLVVEGPEEAEAPEESVLS